MRITVILAIGLLAACTSDVDRLAELRTREANLELGMSGRRERQQAAFDRWAKTDFPDDSLRVWVDSATADWPDVQDSLDLVRRDIDRLLR